MERMASESDQLVNGKSSETVDYDAVFGKASDEHAEDRPAKFAQTTAIGEVCYIPINTFSSFMNKRE